MANSVDQEQTTPIGSVCSGSTVFASILNSLVMLGNYWQQTASADDISDAFCLGALRVKHLYFIVLSHKMSTQIKRVCAKQRFISA